jgi:hypothetical protein
MMFRRSDCAPYQNKFSLARKLKTWLIEIQNFHSGLRNQCKIAIDNEVFRDNDQPENDVRRPPQQRGHNL